MQSVFTQPDQCFYQRRRIAGGFSREPIGSTRVSRLDAYVRMPKKIASG